MNISFKSVLTALAIASAPSAFAAVDSPVNLDLGTLGPTPTSLSAVGTNNRFYVYVYSFNVANNGTALSGGLIGNFFERGGEAYLTGANGFSQTDLSVSSLSFTGLNAGTYQLRLEGHNGFYTSFIGTISASSVAAPVPEAENIAMLAVGLSGVGLVGWRRRRAA